MTVSAAFVHLSPDAWSATLGAFGSSDAAGDPDGPGDDAGVSNSFDQQAGYGVAPGAGL